MKKTTYLALILLTAVFACRKDQEITDVTITPPPGPYVQVKTSIGGLVVDESGGGVSGATVTLGKEITQTDKNGVFNFRNVIANAKGAYIKVEHPAYFHGSRTIMVTNNTRNTVRIQLLSNASTKFINSASGGTADYTDYSVALPAGSVVTAAGATYTGQIGVAAKWLNPVSDEFCDQMPGRLEGFTTDFERTGMVSMGMLAVELKDASGNKLNIKNGFEATLRMKVPAQLLSAAPATIPLWYFDETAGIWVEDGQATLKDGFYEGQVKHFSFWNTDYKAPLVEIKFSVVDQNGNPVEGALINTTFGGRYGRGYTDNMGMIAGLVPKDEVLDAEVFAPTTTCTTPVLQQQIGPFSQNDTYTFAINLGPLLTYTISGDLQDCSGAPVTNGYVLVTGKNEVFWADDNGHFEIELVSCTPLTSVTVTGYDLDALKETLPQVVNLGSGPVNLGVLTACNTIQDYLTYSFNGQTITYVNPYIATIDSMPGGSIDFISIQISSGLYITLNISDVTGTGNYSMSSFNAEGDYNGGFIYHACASGPNNCAGMSVAITEFNGIGGIISGTYSGTLYDYSNQQQPPPPITVSGTFSGTLQ